MNKMPMQELLAEAREAVLQWKSLEEFTEQILADQPDTNRANIANAFHSALMNRRKLMATGGTITPESLQLFEEAWSGARPGAGDVRDLLRHAASQGAEIQELKARLANQRETIREFRERGKEWARSINAAEDWIAVVRQELIDAGGKRGDRTVALRNLRALVRERDELRFFSTAKALRRTIQMGVRLAKETADKNYFGGGPKRKLTLVADRARFDAVVSVLRHVFEWSGRWGRTAPEIEAELMRRARQKPRRRP